MEGTIRITPKGQNLWLVEGSEEFQFLRFSVDTTAQMTALPPTIQYREPEETNRTTSFVVRAPGFGPVIEKVVTGMIDLENGTLMDWPLPEQADEAAPARYAWINDKDPKAWPWMRERGIDAVDANRGLLGVDLMLAPLQSNDWQTLTPEELREKLRTEPLPQTRHSANFGQVPGTYAIRTREGSLGVLEVLGATDGPRWIPSPGVKIRYKLVDAPQPPK
jgi:hypothetical protein